MIPDHEDLAKDNYDRVGFIDTFGRSHWAPLKQLKATRALIREGFVKTHNIATAWDVHCDSWRT
jgi:hypothetical protein